MVYLQPSTTVALMYFFSLLLRHCSPSIERASNQQVPGFLKFLKKTPPWLPSLAGVFGAEPESLRCLRSHLRPADRWRAWSGRWGGLGRHPNGDHLEPWNLERGNFLYTLLGPRAPGAHPKSKVGGVGWGQRGSNHQS